MSSRVVEYIRYRIPEEHSAAFLAAHTRAARALAGSPACVDHELTRRAEDFRHFVLRVTWSSAEEYTAHFRGSAQEADFTAELSPYDSCVRERGQYTPTAARGTGGAVPSLYDRAGGAESFARLTEIFYAKVHADDLLAPLFAGLGAEHAEHVAQWLAEVFGGPAVYSERRGGHGRMVAGHLGRAITEPRRRRWADLLQDAADEAGLPTDPAFRSAFCAYVEWGTRLAVLHSAPDAPTPPEQPVPHWTWGTVPVEGPGAG